MLSEITQIKDTENWERWAWGDKANERPNLRLAY